MKTCSKCPFSGPLEDFPPDVRRKDGRQPYCRRCDNKASSARYEKNKEQAKRDMWRYDLKRLYNMTPDQYNSMLEQQNYCCALCGNTEPGYGSTRFSVDHNHKTGKVRGLLCKGCNLGLGKFKDDSLLLRLAVVYLEER